MENQVLKYKYGSKWWFTIFAILFSCLGMLVFYYKATNNDAGLIINGIIELSVKGANIFFWVLFTFCLIFTFLSLTIAYYSLQGQKYLVLNHKSIIIPPFGINRKRTEIFYKDINNLKEQEINGNFTFIIYYKDKKRGF